MKVLDGENAPPFYSFAMLPPLTAENWFSDGFSGKPEVQIDHLLFRLKREVNGIACYEEM